MRYAKIKKNSEYLKLFKKGKRVYSPYLTLIYVPAKQTGMGIALSKKHGKAVKRNRIKRLIRAAFSNNLSKIKNGYSIIVMPKVVKEYSYDCIEKSLLSCFKRMESLIK